MSSRSIRPAGKRRRLRAIERMLESAWQRGMLPVPKVKSGHLIDVAMRATGLPAADGCWRERLDVLTGALASEASLSSLGRVIAYGQLVMVLKQRLRWQSILRKHPEIADYPIEAPILIVGQMRSGTTRMQRLLACDPRLTFTRFFESWAPFPGGDPRGPDLRPARAWIALRCAHLLNPDFRYIHPVRALQADEEIGLQSISIFGAAFEAQWRVPGFAAHVEAADTRPVYAEFKRLLQTLAWMRRGQLPRPWVLKLPQFAQDLDAVLATFPDARVVRLDRDPIDVVASSASLVRNQMSLQSDAVDAAAIGREWLRKTSLRETRMRAALAQSRVPQVEVGYDALTRDWTSEMTRVYRILGLPWQAPIEQRMASFLAASGTEKLSRHRYDLADFGLTPQDIRREFGGPALSHAG